MVVAGNGFDVKVGETVDLQLEGHGWFQVTVNGVFFKLGRGERVRGRERGREGRERGG